MGHPKRPLYINLDETFVSIAQLGARGNRVHAEQIPQNTSFFFRERLRSKYKRGGITVLGMVCDDTSCQELLPQIIICAEARFSKEVIMAVKATRPGWLHIWREKSAWLDHRLFKKVLTTLYLSLITMLHSRVVVLVCDVARPHIHRDIALQAERYGFRLVYIPAGLTWLLQPLDVMVFAHFKYWLKRLSVDMRLQAGEAEMDILNWWKVVIEAITKCLHDTRAKTIASFMRVGIRHHQLFLSPYVKERVIADGIDYWAPAIPTKEELELLVGRGMVAPHTQLMRPLLESPAVAAGSGRVLGLPVAASTSMSTSGAVGEGALISPEEVDRPVRTHSMVLRKRSSLDRG